MTSTIFIVGQLSVGRAENRRKALEIYEDCAQYALQHEPGVLKYYVTVPRDPSDETTIYAFEEYADQATLEAHIRAPHVTRLIEFLHSDPDILAPIVYHLKAHSAFTRNTTLPSDPTIMFASISYVPDTKRQALQGWREVTSASQKSEPGTLSYNILEDRDDVNKVNVLEVYRDDACLWEVHAKSPAVLWNKQRNGSIRAHLSHVRLKAAVGFLKR